MYSWKKMVEDLTNDFMNWGCRFHRNQLREIALTYCCSPLYFSNWLAGETEKTEKGFLRVLGYAWKKLTEEEYDSLPRSVMEETEAAGSSRIAA